MISLLLNKQFTSKSHGDSHMSPTQMTVEEAQVVVSQHEGKRGRKPKAFHDALVVLGGGKIPDPIATPQQVASLGSTQSRKSDIELLNAFTNALNASSNHQDLAKLLAAKMMAVVERLEPESKVTFKPEPVLETPVFLQEIVKKTPEELNTLFPSGPRSFSPERVEIHQPQIAPPPPGPTPAPVFFKDAPVMPPRVPYDPNLKMPEPKYGPNGELLFQLPIGFVPQVQATVPFMPMPFNPQVSYPLPPMAEKVSKLQNWTQEERKTCSEELSKMSPEEREENEGADAHFLSMYEQGLVDINNEFIGR